jgi:hypothetical protein
MGRPTLIRVPHLAGSERCLLLQNGRECNGALDCTPYASADGLLRPAGGVPFTPQKSVEDGSREVVRVALLGPDGPIGAFTRWEIPRSRGDADWRT